VGLSGRQQPKDRRSRRSRRSRRNQEGSKKRTGANLPLWSERGNLQALMVFFCLFFGHPKDQRKAFRRERGHVRGWGYDKPNSVCLIKSNMFYLDAIGPLWSLALSLSLSFQGRAEQEGMLSTKKTQNVILKVCIGRMCDTKGYWTL